MTALGAERDLTRLEFDEFFESFATLVSRSATLRSSRSICRCCASTLADNSQMTLTTASGPA